MIAATLSASVRICLQPDGSACQGHTAAPGDKKKGRAPLVILNIHISFFFKVRHGPSNIKRYYSHNEVCHRHPLDGVSGYRRFITTDWQSTEIHTHIALGHIQTKKDKTRQPVTKSRINHKWCMDPVIQLHRQLFTGNIMSCDQMHVIFFTKYFCL